MLGKAELKKQSEGQLVLDAMEHLENMTPLLKCLGAIEDADVADAYRGIEQAKHSLSLAVNRIPRY